MFFFNLVCLCISTYEGAARPRQQSLNEITTACYALLIGVHALTNIQHTTYDLCVV